jgi:hypothetical protein
MNTKKTHRGFKLVSFSDINGHDCSLQESSLATDRAVWLGIDDADPKAFVPGKGWASVDLDGLVDGELLLSTRMHLTQMDVRALLPYLERFAETGELYAEEPSP